MHLFFVGVLSVYGTCNKNSNCNDVDYSFLAGMKVTPDRDSVNIGDTIWLELSTPKIFTDNNTNQQVEFAGAINLGTDINFDKLLGNHNVSFCASCFDLIPVKGTFINDNFVPERNKDYRFLEEADKYAFKLAIIPKQRGTYSISIGDASGVYTPNKKCVKASFKYSFQNTNQHLYLYQQNRPGYQISDYERTHMYCFKVN